MLTIEQIEEANSKVKTGADFPQLARALAALGVKSNDVYVRDGHAEYFGGDGDRLSTGAIYPPREIADAGDAEKFKNYLKIHQRGETDYPAFCRQAAETGVEKWTIDFDKMTCTYFDKAGREMLTETIPAV